MTPEDAVRFPGPLHILVVVGGVVVVVVVVAVVVVPGMQHLQFFPLHHEFSIRAPSSQNLFFVTQWPPALTHSGFILQPQHTQPFLHMLVTISSLSQVFLQDPAYFLWHWLFHCSSHSTQQVLGPRHNL